MNNHPRSRFGRWVIQRLPLFYANWITSLGSILLLVAVMLLLGALGLHIANAAVGRHGNPYLDMVVFMLLPMILIMGIVLIILGNTVQKRRLAKGLVGKTSLEQGGGPLVRKVLLVGGMAVVALVAFGSFGYEAYHYTDSTAFCMKVCHEVMEPEGVAYERSPHANVACVKCHIGPGADWFVKAKISGLRQVIGVLTNDFRRPVPAPVHALRPARDTCESCHRPDHFLGSQLIVYEHTEPDEDNTPSVTAVVLKVGGNLKPGIPATGVHWHVDPANEVRYRAVDEKREKIVEVIRRTPDGEVRFLSSDADEYAEQGEWRIMDCIDCHNRPAHIFEIPHRVLDESFVFGHLDSNVPWLRAVTERVLWDVVPSDNTAGDLAAALHAIYATEYPDALAALEAVLDPTAVVLTEILEGNVFPDMKVTWGTYPSHVGHMDLTGDYSEDKGCFRCHDEDHETEDGESITQDCDACHTIIAERETDLDDLPDFVSAVLIR